MDEREKTELWLHYSTIWRNVLTHVLGWRAERVNEYIEDLREEMEIGAHDPAGYGFFFDPPAHYLFRPILGGGLHDRIMQCKSDEANPSLIFQRLEASISGGLNHWNMDKESFDWNQARQRYQSERRKIEESLTTFENL
jgi:hypothetical protein